MPISSRSPAAGTALAFIAVLAAIDIAGPLLPDSEGEVAFGVVAAVLLAIAAYGIYEGRAWGYWMGIVLAVLHALSDGAAILAVDDTLLKVLAAVAVIVAVVLLVVLVKARSSAVPPAG